MGRPRILYLKGSIIKRKHSTFDMLCNLGSVSHSTLGLFKIREHIVFRMWHSTGHREGVEGLLVVRVPGCVTFLTQASPTPACQSIRGNLGAEDPPAPCRFLPRIAGAEQRASPAAVGQGGPRVSVDSNCPHAGLFSASKSFSAPTAAFPL